MITRRAFIRGVAAVPVVGVAGCLAVPAVVVSDPVETVMDEFHALMVEETRGCLSDLDAVRDAFWAPIRQFEEFPIGKCRPWGHGFLDGLVDLKPNTAFMKGQA